VPEDELLDMLELISESVRLVQDRFAHIKTPEEFCTSSEGTTLLDAITMRLQVVGESVKQIQKLDAAYLDDYREIQWDKIARFRDLVSHHYENVDYEIVYDICKNHIPQLAIVLVKMREDFKEGSR
jgi:uncharacterized protein with HEPN domain